MRIASLAAAALVLLTPARAAAEWQIRPFVGFTFGGATTFVDPENAAGAKNPVVGVTGGWLGDIFGVEGDFGSAPGFFQVLDRKSPDWIVVTSGVTTLMGSVVIALPRRMAEYGLRPYFAGGAGLMHVSHESRLGVLPVARTLPAMTLGGGVTGFLTNRVGLNWDIRRIGTMPGKGETLGSSFGDEELSFWRATMAVAIRY